MAGSASAGATATADNSAIAIAVIVAVASTANGVAVVTAAANAFAGARNMSADFNRAGRAMTSTTELCWQHGRGPVGRSGGTVRREFQFGGVGNASLGRRFMTGR